MGLERNFFVWHCTPLVAFIGPVSSIAVASRVEELDPVHVDKVPIILSACFLVPPRLSALAAFQINTAAFVEILDGDFRAPQIGRASCRERGKSSVILVTSGRIDHHK